MRTADRVIAGNWSAPFGQEDHRQLLGAVARDLRTCPVIVADNVAHYVNVRRPEICLEAYPSLAPPWPQFWIEYPSSSRRMRRGVMVMDVTDMCDGRPANLDGVAVSLADLGRGAVDHALENGSSAEDIRWVVMMILVVEQDEMVWGPAGTMSFALDAGGQVIGNRWSVAPIDGLRAAADAAHEESARLRNRDDHAGPAEELLAQAEAGQVAAEDRAAAIVTLCERRDQLQARAAENDDLARRLQSAVPVLEHVEALTEDEAEAGATWLTRALAPAMQTIAFMHCRNAVLDPVSTPRKVQAKRRAKGKEPLVRYNTLRLDLPRRGGRGGGGGGGGGDLTALHIVGGHFAHYGACCTNHPPKGLLFGSLTGVYWVASHVRGDKDAGTVVTDFKVGAVP